MKVKIIAIAIALMPVKLFSATPFAVVDGTVQFAIATVGGSPAFTQAEKSALISGPGGAVVDLTPSFYEMAVSTTVGRFDSYEDFFGLTSSKAYIFERVKAYVTDRSANERLAVDYPAHATLLNNKNKKTTAIIDLLVALAGTL